MKRKIATKKLSRNAELAAIFEAAAGGQTAPFMQSGAQWSGNAYEEAKGRAASLYAIAQVYRNLANQEKTNA